MLIASSLTHYGVIFAHLSRISNHIISLIYGEQEISIKKVIANIAHILYYLAPNLHK
jgi:hypothetical protein